MSFADHAAAYAARGLRCFPVGGDNGKTPLVQGWRRFGTDSWQRLKDNPVFAGANIGILDGYRIMRVDCDDTSYDDLIEKRFGRTPVVVQTPSGGTHRWYKSNGERRIIRLDGAPIDILGYGGYGVAPPSEVPDGRCWRFIEGSLDDLRRLPKLKPGSLPDFSYRPGDGDVGQRNQHLFAAVRQQAKHVETIGELQIWAEAFNETFDQPLSEREVNKVVHSVWKGRREGRISMNPDTVDLSIEDIEGLRAEPDSAYFLLWLISHHGGRRDRFALSVPAIAKELGWTERRVRIVRSRLCERDYLRLVHQGGRKKGDCNVYAWFGPAKKFAPLIAPPMGTKSHYNASPFLSGI